MAGASKWRTRDQLGAARRTMRSKAVWHRLAAQPVSPRELRLEYTLQNGQCLSLIHISEPTRRS
eukprot:925782-Prymnesium_polylepis.1